EDLPEQAEDKTLPKWKQIHKRAGQYVVQWGEVLDEHYRMWQKDNDRHPKPTANGGVKRGASVASGGGAAGKKVKTEDGDGDIMDEEMRAAYAKDAVKKFTVAQLKGWMGGKGIGKGITKKADVVDQVNRWFETKMEVD
ncbi:ATP-dependent DNA helicase II subunit 1, partial [Teratosphaeriaceae sp. CCFEE 6253]